MKILLSTSMSGLGGTEHATYRLGKLLCDTVTTCTLPLQTAPWSKMP